MKEMYNGERIYHPFGPLYSENSHVLILGSFPSVKSREQEFFYGHPQNRFWKVMGALFGPPCSYSQTDGEEKNAKGSAEGKLYVPKTIEEKKELILDNGLALWDSIGSCEITGSSDASIRNAEPNDLRIITGNCDIRAIYCNGKKSLEVYNKYIKPVLGREAEALPSTSPANAAWSLDRLINAWSVIKGGKMFDESKAANSIALFCRLNTRARITRPLRGSEIGLLFYLGSGVGEPTSVAAADFFMVSKAAISVMVKSLVSKGLLVKVRSETDARQYQLILTDKGTEIMNTVAAAYENRVRVLRAKLGEENFDAFVRLLDDANEIIAEELGL